MTSAKARLTGLPSLILSDSQVAQPQPNGKTLLAPPSLCMLMIVQVSQPMFQHGKVTREICQPSYYKTKFNVFAISNKLDCDHKTQRLV